MDIKVGDIFIDEIDRDVIEIIYVDDYFIRAKVLEDTYGWGSLNIQLTKKSMKKRYKLDKKRATRLYRVLTEL